MFVIISAVCQNNYYNSSFRSAADSDDYVAFYFMQVMQGSQLCMDPKINELLFAKPGLYS